MSMSTIYTRTDYGNIVAAEYTAQEHVVIIHVLDDPTTKREVPEGWEEAVDTTHLGTVVDMLSELLAPGPQHHDVHLSGASADGQDRHIEVWTP